MEHILCEWNITELLRLGKWEEDLDIRRALERETEASAFHAVPLGTAVRSCWFLSLSLLLSFALSLSPPPFLSLYLSNRMVARYLTLEKRQNRRLSGIANISWFEGCRFSMAFSDISLTAGRYLCQANPMCALIYLASEQHQHWSNGAPDAVQMLSRKPRVLDLKAKGPSNWVWVYVRRPSGGQEVKSVPAVLHTGFNCFVLSNALH